jgi:hypothetical protein
MFRRFQQAAIPGQCEVCGTIDGSATVGIWQLAFHFVNGEFAVNQVTQVPFDLPDEQKWTRQLHKLLGKVAGGDDPSDNLVGSSHQYVAMFSNYRNGFK